MILANIRQRLSRDDAQLALRLVSRGSETAYAQAEQTLRQEGLDALLDDPRLPEALVESRQAAHASLPLFSYVVVRHALRQVHEDDRGISDYVASILVHFAMNDNAYRIGGADDEIYDTLAALLADVDHGDATRRFLVRTHLGNYALWVGGMFPDHWRSAAAVVEGRIWITSTKWVSAGLRWRLNTAWRSSTGWKGCFRRSPSAYPVSARRSMT